MLIVSTLTEYLVVICCERASSLDLVRDARIKLKPLLAI